MHGVQLAGTVPASAKETPPSCERPATITGFRTPAKFLSSLFEETPLTHRYQEPRTVRHPNGCAT